MFIRKPFTISKITSNLYISSWPGKEDLDTLKEYNFDLIIHVLWQHKAKGIEDIGAEVAKIVLVDSPLTPLPMKSLEKGVRKALPVIENGGKVLVYCKSGVHRSVAMVCCILIAQGKTSEEAMEIVKKGRKQATPETKYIKSRIMKFEKYWNG